MSYAVTFSVSYSSAEIQSVYYASLDDWTQESNVFTIYTAK